MYPEPVQLQSMQNRRVVYQLAQHGDPLTVPRPVEHWIYFKTERDRETYWNRVNAKGFELTEMTTDAENGGECPYLLRITREDMVDYDSIDECVLPLWGLATELNGNYDGWETGIVGGEE
jgi:regulator of RNase E activity RraB